MNKTLQLSLSVSLVIIALAVGYYFTVSLPEQESKKLQQEQSQWEKDRASVGNRMEWRMSCIEQSRQSYSERWEQSCERLKRGEDCALPDDIAKTYESDRQIAEENCIKLTTE